MTTNDKSEATDSEKKSSAGAKPSAAAAPAKLVIPVGAPVRFWRNKRPLTMRDFQEATVVAVGPKKANAGDEDKGVAVELAEGEYWLRVTNAANGKHFLVVAKPSDAPSPGAFTPEQVQAASAPPAAAPVVTSEEQGSGGGAEA